MVDFQETTVKFESSVVMEKCSLSCDTWKQFLLKEKCFCFFSYSYFQKFRENLVRHFVVFRITEIFVNTCIKTISDTVLSSKKNRNLR